MAPERSQVSKYYLVLKSLGIPQLAINTVVITIIDVKHLSIALFTREIILPDENQMTHCQLSA